MYEERRDKFTLKDVIIQILFIGVFIFLLMWLFPMKGSVNKAIDKSINEGLNNGLSPLYDQIFNQNVTSMKEAAISYYTTPRLPSKVGAEEKMTLSEMLNMNIILPFVDKSGNQCDLIESYVSMTKMDEEYILKINLKCGKQEDYLLVHLGCYDYCEGNVCEKQPEPSNPSKPVIDQPKPVTPVVPEIPTKQYEYEYVKVTDGMWGEYGNWSDWTKNIITETNYRQVEKKTVEETTMITETVETKKPIYGTKTVQTGTKQEPYTAYKTVDVYETQKVPYTAYRNETVTVPGTPIYTNKCVQYKTQQVQTGTEPIYSEVCSNKQVKVGSEGVYEIKCEYVFVKMEYSLDCTDTCKRVEKPVYKQECTRVQTGTKDKYETKQVCENKQTGSKPIYKTVTTNECARWENVQTGTTPSSTKTIQVPYTAYRYEKVKTGTKQEPYTAYRTVPVYSTVTVITGYEPVSITVEKPVTNKVTYYRSRTREYIAGTIDTKWSTSQADQNLISNGYTLTGNSRELNK